MRGNLGALIELDTGGGTGTSGRTGSGTGNENKNLLLCIKRKQNLKVVELSE